MKPDPPSFPCLCLQEEREVSGRYRDEDESTPNVTDEDTETAEETTAAPPDDDTITVGGGVWVVGSEGSNSHVAASFDDEKEAEREEGNERAEVAIGNWKLTHTSFETICGRFTTPGPLEIMIYVE